MNTNAHFLAIVPKDGRIIELDGRKAFAIDHGPYESLETFALEASEKVVRREFMDKDPDEIRFSMMALGAAGGD
jgi:ubiquitin carboxyl-terminal hydrolase L3